MSIKAVLGSRDLRVVIGFVLACVLGFVWLFVNSGGTIPGVAGAGSYRVRFVTDDVKNLRSTGEVRIAGVRIGRVESTTIDGTLVRVELSLEGNGAPLHQGATVRVGVKSLLGSSFVDIKDGTGPEIPDGSTLDPRSVIPAVDVDELYATLDQPTRTSLQRAARSLDVLTRGRGKDLDTIVGGAGVIGDQGAAAASALAAQSKDLVALTVETTHLLDALDTGRGEIAALVSDAQVLTSVTARKQDKVEATVRALPALVQSLQPAAAKLNQLGGTLAPVAVSLRQAAPDLSAALVNLPATSADLDGLVPSLNQVLGKAPATLDRIPGLDSTVRDVVPTGETMLRDVDPMLAYLQPYGLDLGALFASFGASFDTLAEDGIRPIRLTATGEGVGTFRGNPLQYSQLNNTTTWFNPYPAPGTAGAPAPFSGSYPQVERDPQ